MAGGSSPVPTLVISGAEDLRTPRERASAVAGQYPGATLLNVPYTGPLGGAERPLAVRGARRVRLPRRRPAHHGVPADAAAVCRSSPRAPRRFASLRGRTRRAKTLRAARLTLRDLTYQLAAASRARIGGLRGGRAVLFPRTLSVRLVGYRYVPKVRVSGRLRLRNGRLVGAIRVRGGGARPARIGVRASGRLRARFSAAPRAAAAIVGVDRRAAVGAGGPAGAGDRARARCRELDF